MRGNFLKHALKDRKKVERKLKNLFQNYFSWQHIYTTCISVFNSVNNNTLNHVLIKHIYTYVPLLHAFSHSKSVFLCLSKKNKKLSTLW